MRNWLLRVLVPAAALGVALCGVGAPASIVARQSTTAAGQKPAVKTLAPANAVFTEFKENLQRYLDLRAGVEASLPKLTGTNDPKKIAERAALLASGIQAARRNAKPGDVFTPPVAVEFRRILAADAATRTPADRANIMAEVPEKPPVVNALYPTDSPSGPAALPSFPPKLLAVLPELPDTVEYRYLGQSLVLRDASANLIIDYLPRVAPGRGRQNGGGARGEHGGAR